MIIASFPSAGRLVRGIFLLLATLAVAACNDDPSGVGDTFIPGDLETHVLRIPPADITFTSGIAKVNNSSSFLNSAVLVGNTPDGTKAHGLFSIVDHSDRLLNITANDIVSAELRVRTLDYRSDDRSGVTTFDLVYFDGTFSNVEQYSVELDGRLDGGVLLGSLNTNLPDTSNVRVSLSPSETAEFLNGYFELDTVKNSDGTETVQTVTLLSLGLRARTDGTAIASFLGATVQDVPDSLLPTLIVTLQDTIVSLPMGVSNWVVAPPSSFAVGAGSASLMGGAPVRTLVHFPIDSIPEDALILQAELTLFVDELSELVGTTGQIDNTVAFVAGKDPLGEESRLDVYPVNFGARFIPGFRGAVDETTLENVIRFPGLNTPITEWIKHKRTGGTSGFANNGMIIALGRSQPDLESGTVDRLSFHGTAAADGLRPIVEITYAIPRRSN